MANDSDRSVCLNYLPGNFAAVAERQLDRGSQQDGSHAVALLFRRVLPVQTPGIVRCFQEACLKTRSTSKDSLDQTLPTIKPKP